MRQILVTSALPYANGSIHLGHLVEYIQTDIWVRAMRSLGHKVTYVCADDAHGTAIMLKAEENGVTPEQQINAVNAEHQADFAKFLINFDNYYSTHSEENRHLSDLIYRRLDAGDHITTADVEQLFDPEKQMFLSDRFVKGECPKCGTPDQYGDNCEACGSTYNAIDLINPYSTLSGAKPILKSSEHYFFKLPDFESFLQKWTWDDGRLQESIRNKLQEWFDSGLENWDISRDAPYFGFKIPKTDDKYFYVWLDAPIGYMASFKNLCDRREDLDFDEYWLQENAHKTEVYHFIGKDIVYFHALFWPAMLSGSDFRTPNAVFAHGFLTVNGKKMSKSRGTFIKADTYAEHLNPEYLRYYFASKLSEKVEDINLDLTEFMQKVNSDLIGKVINIASRCAVFLQKFDGKLAQTCAEPVMIEEIDLLGEQIAAAYENREFSKAMRLIMQIADRANEYINEKQPWLLAKEAGKEADVLAVCSVGIEIFRQLIIYLAPVLPELAEKVKTFLNLEDMSFASRHQLLLGHQINAFTPLMQRIEEKQINAIIEASKQAFADDEDEKPKKKYKKNPKNTEQNQDKNENETDLIDIDTFAKVHMTVAKVLDCRHVEGADKLLQFSLDVGEDKPRNVFSGIRQFYEPEQLQGKKVICITNLAPRKMKFGISEGMILSAGDPKTGLVVITLPEEAIIGSRLA